MKIHGAHVILFSKNAEADRSFFDEVLQYPSVDAGGGWPIFALPPAEVAMHPSDENDVHELYLMCDDVHDLIAHMTKRNIACSPIHEERWGSLTHLTLPSGSKLGVYQPKHASPLTTKARAQKSAKTPAKAKAKTKTKTKPKKKAAKAKR